MPGPKGRPKTLDDKEVRRLFKKLGSARAVARELGVTHGAINASLKRSK
jgi:DNA invertase Pin-like site-specific DNA recombinase